MRGQLAKLALLLLLLLLFLLIDTSMESQTDKHVNMYTYTYVYVYIYMYISAPIYIYTHVCALDGLIFEVNPVWDASQRLRSLGYARLLDESIGEEEVRCARGFKWDEGLGCTWRFMVLISQLQLYLWQYL